MKAKKIFKGMTAAAIAAVITASMVPMTAFATGDEGGTITVTTTSTSLNGAETLRYYKVANLDQSGQYVWEWNTAAFKNSTVPDSVAAYDLNLTTDTGDKKAVTSSNVATVAAILERTIQTDESSMSNILTSSQISGSEAYKYTATVNEDGYYLILVNNKQADMMYQPMLIEVKNGQQAEVTGAKASKITFTKQIKGVEAAVSGLQDNGGISNGVNVAQVKTGDTIKYQLHTQIPNYDFAVKDLTSYTDYVITDTPTNMEIDTTSIEVWLSSDASLDADDTKLNDTNGAATNYTVSKNSSTGEVTITFDKTNVIFADADNNGTADYQGYHVFVNLNATLKSGATIEGDGNINTGKVTYGSNYTTGGDSRDKTDTAKVYTTKLKIEKIKDGDSTTKLSNAEFKLYQQSAGSTEYTELKINSDGFVDKNGTATIKTDTSGAFEIKGLSAGAYRLIETKAPSGYKLDSTPINFTINKELDNTNKTAAFSIPSGAVVIQRLSSNDGFITTVKNTEGQSLPGTGGIGTTIFTVGGIAVVLAAGVMLIIYMKKRKVEE